MKYFKHIDNDTYAIWIVDGERERCIYHTNPDHYLEMYFSWFTPETESESPIKELIKTFPTQWKEISEEDAFLESV